MLLTSGIVVLLLAQVWNSLGSAPTTGVEHAIGIEHAIGALAGVETRLFSASATLDEMSAHANAHDGSPSAHAAIDGAAAANLLVGGRARGVPGGDAPSAVTFQT